MSLLLDTCALLWWTLDPGKLAPRAHEALEGDKRRQLYISSISIWEIGIKLKNGKLEIGTDIADYTRRLAALERLQLLPVDEAVWIKNLQLDWDHRDPADRTIVATALLHNLAIITADLEMAKAGPEIIW